LSALANVSDMQEQTDEQVAIAVVGCGNPNRSDDGVGSEVIRTLASRELAADARVRLLDAGTDGMGVMFAARGCHSLIIIDACRSGSQPGAVFEIPGNGLERPSRASLTLHDFRWDDALFAGRRMFKDSFPQDVVVLLIEAFNVEFGIGLSPPVAAAMKKAAARVEDLLRLRLRQTEAVP
jgi:hydrogenase maturation protease